MKKRIFQAFLCLMISTMVSYAQNIAVVGKVADETGSPVAGASVQIKNQPRVYLQTPRVIFPLTLPKGLFW